MKKTLGPIQPQEKEFTAASNHIPLLLANFNCDTPAVGNGNVSFRRWKVSIEAIEEPQEVLAERLQQLWDNASNFHHWAPLRKAAAEIGYTLQGNPGNKIQR